MNSPKMPTLRHLTRFERECLRIDWRVNWFFDVEERRIIDDYVGTTRFTNFLASLPEREKK